MSPSITSTRKQNYLLAMPKITGYVSSGFWYVDVTLKGTIWNRLYIQLLNYTKEKAIT